MERVAFLTYNTVVDGLANGWQGSNGHRALVLQNTNGEGARKGGPIGAAKRGEQIDALWEELLQQLTDLDHVVVYVGTRGSERAIAYAALLPASKVTFVLCDCGLPFKEDLIQMAGLTDARRMPCECGGHRTMKTLYERFLETGELQPA